MARLAACNLVAALSARVYGIMEFINPPPFGTTGDLSDSPTYDEGTTVNVAWTQDEDRGGVSLCLFQQNKTDGTWFGDMEYLTQNALDITRYSWLVGTRKNLTLSNLFYLSVFQEGKGSPDSNSHYFYIKSKRTEENASPSSSMFSSRSGYTPTAAPVSTPTGLSTSSISIGTMPMSTPTSNTTDLQNLSGQVPPADGFPLGAKIGLGVGIPIALILGLVGGWLLFRHHKKREAVFPYMGHEVSASQTKQHVYYNNGGFCSTNVSEAPAKSPVEIGQHYV